jgi:hypothetical protein
MMAALTVRELAYLTGVAGNLTALALSLAYEPHIALLEREALPGLALGVLPSGATRLDCSR